MKAKLLLINSGFGVDTLHRAGKEKYQSVGFVSLFFFFLLFTLQFPVKFVSL